MNTFLKKHWVTLVGIVGIIVILVGVGLFFLPQYLCQGGICAFCGLILFIIAVINHEVEVPAEQDAKVAKHSQADVEKQDRFETVLALVSLGVFLIVAFLIPDTWKYWGLCASCATFLMCTVWFVLYWKHADNIGPKDGDVGCVLLIVLIMSFILMLGVLCSLF